MRFFTDFRLCGGAIDALRTLKQGTTLDRLKQRFRRLDAFYLQVFAIIFLAANAVFLIYTANYLFGNHDFPVVKKGVSIALWHGRFTNAVPLLLFGGGNLSPVLNSFLSISAMSLSSMLLCGFYGLPKRKRYWVPACLLPMLLPYVLSWFYYSYETFSHVMLPGLAAAALWLVREKFTLERMLLSTALVWFALGVYPSVMAFFALVIGGQFLLDLARQQEAKRILRRCAASAAVFLLGAAAFKITLSRLIAMGKTSSDLYSLDMPSGPALLRKIVPELTLGFKQFFCAAPYLPVPLKLALLAVIAAAVLVTAVRIFRPEAAEGARPKPWEKPLRLLLALAVWLGMFFATMIPDLLSNIDISYTVRTAYFGVPFLAMIALIFVLRFGGGVMANAAVLVVAVVLWCSAIADLEIQKNWKIGFENEMLAYSRVLAMIEQSPEVCALESPINYLQIGSLPSGRRPFCRPPITDGKHSLELHSFIFNPDWSPRAGGVFDYLGTHLKFKYTGSFRVDMPAIETFFDTKSPAWRQFLADARAYPAPPERCLFVDRASNSLVIVLDEEVLQQVKRDCGVE